MTDGGVKRGPGAAVFAHLDRFLNRRGLKTFIAIGEVAAFVSLIVGGVGALVNLLDGDDPVAEPPVSTASRSTDTPPTTTAPPAPSGPTVISGPKCWTAAKVVVDCRETHRFEEIPQAPTCGEAVVTGFLGGLAEVDVLVAHPAALPGAACALDAGRDVRDSAEDVLQTADAAAWRRCFDRTKGRNVPCSTVHTGEYVATGNSRRANESECLVAAATYLDQLPGNLTEHLTVRALDVKSGHPDPARCIIDARGNSKLSGSVRDLGSRPVPLATN